MIMVRISKLVVIIMVGVNLAAADTEVRTVPEEKQCYHDYRITAMSGPTSDQLPLLTPLDTTISAGTVQKCDQNEDCYYFTMDGSAQVIVREDLQGRLIREESGIVVSVAQCLPTETVRVTDLMCQEWLTRIQDSFDGNDMLTGKVSGMSLSCGPVAVCSDVDECVSDDDRLPDPSLGPGLSPLNVCFMTLFIFSVNLVLI